MALYIHKYGGTSLATAGRIRDIAARLARAHEAGDRLIVVVSAMGGETDRLRAAALDICPEPDARELDMLLTAGERVSMSLMAMALKAAGVPAISLTGSQSGIITDGRHNRARVLEIRGERIQEALDGGAVAIVAGFQGVSRAREVTTLGRGGSDLTAVRLAARFQAAACRIFTDVDGVYTANPGRVPGARRLREIDTETMVRFAALGAGVLHPEAAAAAHQEDVELRVLSSFIPGQGTRIAKGLATAVVAIGCVHDALEIQLGDAASEQTAEMLRSAGVTPLACLPGAAGGTALYLAARDLGDAGEALAAAGGLGAPRRQGDLVAIVQPASSAPPPASMLPAGAVTGPGTALTLVDPAASDRLVHNLHATLVGTAKSAR